MPFHGPDFIIILVIALLIFGPKKLPEMGSAIGKSIKEFKKGVNELTAPKDEDMSTPTASRLEAIEREIAARTAAATTPATASSAALAHDERESAAKQAAAEASQPEVEVSREARVD